MTMYEQSQQSDWLQTELELMSSQAASPAKTSQQQDKKQELKASAVDYGQSAPVFLGSFDPDTPSLKTSQTCLMENGELGLSEFSGTFPRSGMMRSGTVYQLPHLAHITEETGFGLWPTPTATANQGAPSMQKRYRRPHFWPTPCAHESRLGYQRRDTGKKGTQKSLTTLVIDSQGGRDQVVGTLNPTWVEWLMGFPLGHTDLNA